MNTQELNTALDKLYYPEKELTFEEGVAATEKTIEFFWQWRQWLEEKYGTGIPASMKDELWHFANHGTSDRQLIEANYEYIASFARRAIQASQSESSSEK